MNDGLYAAGYRAVQRNGAASLDVWNETLAVGAALPNVPLWLRGGICLPVELAASYERTCREQRIVLPAFSPPAEVTPSGPPV